MEYFFPSSLTFLCLWFHQNQSYHQSKTLNLQSGKKRYCQTNGSSRLKAPLHVWKQTQACLGFWWISYLILSILGWKIPAWLRIYSWALSANALHAIAYMEDTAKLRWFIIEDVPFETFSRGNISTSSFQLLHLLHGTHYCKLYMQYVYGSAFEVKTTSNLKSLSGKTKEQLCMRL